MEIDCALPIWKNSRGRGFKLRGRKEMVDGRVSKMLDTQKLEVIPVTVISDFVLCFSRANEVLRKKKPHNVVIRVLSLYL